VFLASWIAASKGCPCPHFGASCLMVTAQTFSPASKRLSSKAGIFRLNPSWSLNPFSKLYPSCFFTNQSSPNTNAINKVTMYGRRLGRPQAPVAEGGPGHSWRRTLSQVPPPTGGGNTRRPCHPSKEHPPMNSSPNAPWKEGRERSDRWKENPTKGFLPRVSDGTGSSGPGGCGRPKRRPNGDVILIIMLILVQKG
jgi:hypothetical protein